MSLFSSLFEKKRSQIENVIVEHILAGNGLMLHGGTSHDKNGSKFEATIISVLFLLRFAETGAPKEYETIEKIAFDCLLEIGHKVEHSIPMDLIDFVNMRFKQNAQELDGVLESQGKRLPARTSFNLYGTPLMPNSGELLNPMKFITFSHGFSSYLKLTQEVIPMISGIIRHS